MAPRLILNINIVIFPLILALISSSLAQEEAAVSKIQIYITSAFPKSKNLPVVTVQLSGQTLQLSPGQQSQLRIDQPGGGLGGLATYSNHFTAFKAYNPARDKGHAVVYWKVDDWGFSISYDNKKWTKVAEWETE